MATRSGPDLNLCPPVGIADGEDRVVGSGSGGLATHRGGRLFKRDNQAVVSLLRIKTPTSHDRLSLHRAATARRRGSASQ